MKNLLYILLLSPLFFISSCEEDVVHGCLDSQACNYNSQATIDNNSCEYPPSGYDCDDVFGCTDSLACNYNPEATIDNNSCEYPPSGYDCDDVCIDEQACNFGLTEQCQYPELGYDCEGNFTEIVVGMEAEGGIVFEVYDSGEHGWVVALEDLTEGATTIPPSADPLGIGYNGYEWGCFQEEVNGADGAGYQNTMDIVNQGCSTENGGITAAQAAIDYEIDGYIDWYLPSKNDLEAIYFSIGQGSTIGNIGGFEPVSYWSSSELNDFENQEYAYRFSFNSGNSHIGNKTNIYRVRVIRAF